MPEPFEPDDPLDFDSPELDPPDLDPPPLDPPVDLEPDSGLELEPEPPDFSEPLEPLLSLEPLPPLLPFASLPARESVR